MLAPGHVKAFHRGLQAYLARELDEAETRFREAADKAPSALAPPMMLGLVAAAKGDVSSGVLWLERVVQSDSVLPDAWSAKWLDLLQVPVRITEQATAFLPANSVSAALLLIEAYQDAGRLEDAIGVAQQLRDQDPSDAVIRLSLADLLYDDGDDEAVVEAAAGVESDDDITLATVLLRAKAMLRAGMAGGAAAELTPGLRRTSGRSETLIREVRYTRAEAYAAAGQKAKARADFEKIYAEQPGYRDVRARLTGETVSTNPDLGTDV